MKRSGTVLMLAMIAAVTAIRAADLIVSANDAKYVRVNGADTYPPGRGPDTLTVIDASTFPPKIRTTVAVEHTLAGPPQAVAITPNGAIAIVSAPNRYDYARHTVILDTFLQVVDLGGSPPRVVRKVQLGAHPQGLAVNGDGTLLLAATLSGTVAVLSIAGTSVTLLNELKVCDGRLSGVSFTHDGKAALVALRDEQGIRVLDVAGKNVTLSRERISTGVAPYSVDVSSRGELGIVSNVGLAGLSNPGQLSADADSVTLIDLSSRPFRAIQYLTVPSIPEGAALSPDGKWIAVQAMDGSNLALGNPGRHDRGRVVLFKVEDRHAVEVDSLPGGQAAQGIVFSADSRYIYVQFNVEKCLAVFAVDEGRLRDTGERLAVSGGPASLRSMPR